MDVNYVRRIKYSNQKLKNKTTCKNVSFGNTPGEAIISGKLIML